MGARPYQTYNSKEGFFESTMEVELTNDVIPMKDIESPSEDEDSQCEESLPLIESLSEDEDSQCEESLSLIDNVHVLAMERKIRTSVLTATMKKEIVENIITWRKDFEKKNDCTGKQYGKFLCARDPSIGIHLVLPVEYQYVLFDEDDGTPSLILKSEPYEIKKWLRNHKTINCLLALDKRRKFWGAGMLTWCIPSSSLFAYNNIRLQVYLRSQKTSGRRKTNV